MRQVRCVGYWPRSHRQARSRQRPAGPKGSRATVLVGPSHSADRLVRIGGTRQLPAGPLSRDDQRRVCEEGVNGGDSGVAGLLGDGAGLLPALVRPPGLAGPGEGVATVDEGRALSSLSGWAPRRPAAPAAASHDFAVTPVRSPADRHPRRHRSGVPWTPRGWRSTAAPLARCAARATEPGPARRHCTPLLCPASQTASHLPSLL
jgi:hypothetical protein